MIFPGKLESQRAELAALLQFGENDNSDAIRFTIYV
jgi:hypothetical protein